MTNASDLPDEPIMDVAHLGHIELLTPTPDESLRFFVDVMGMTESGRQGNSVYLRGWDDYERYSLKLTGSHTSAWPRRLPGAQSAGAAALRRRGGGLGAGRGLARG
jgi:catechol 2,3-dioxygenase